MIHRYLMRLAAALIACGVSVPAQAQFDSNPRVPDLLREGKIKARPENLDALLDVAAVYFAISTINRCGLKNLPDGVNSAMLMSDFTDYLNQRPDLAALVSPTFPLLAAHPASLSVTAQVLAKGCDHRDIQNMLAQSIIVLSDHGTRDLARTYAKTGVPVFKNKSRKLAGHWRVLGPRQRDDAASEAERQVIVNSLVVTGNADQEIMDCSYGPMQSDGRGFREYSFWKDRLPPFSRDDILRMGPNSELANLPYVAVPACPTTEAIAASIVDEHGFVYPSKVPFDPSILVTE